MRKNRCCILFLYLILLCGLYSCSTSLEEEYVLIRVTGNGSSIPGINAFEYKHCLGDFSKTKDMKIGDDLWSHDQDIEITYEDALDLNRQIRNKIHNDKSCISSLLQWEAFNQAFDIDSGKKFSIVYGEDLMILDLYEHDDFNSIKYITEIKEKYLPKELFDITEFKIN